MYVDPTRNYDYNPQSKLRGNGVLQGDHITPRSQYLAAGKPVPLPDRLLHSECNRMRGEGLNDDMAWVNSV